MLTIRTKADVEKRLGIALTDSEWNRYAEAAILKIARIIEREGDAEGSRQQDWYFHEILAEIINIDRVSKYSIRAQKKTARRQPSGQEEREKFTTSIVAPELSKVKKKEEIS